MGVGVWSWNDCDKYSVKKMPGHISHSSLQLCFVVKKIKERSFLIYICSEALPSSSVKCKLLSFSENQAFWVSKYSIIFLLTTVQWLSFKILDQLLFSISNKGRDQTMPWLWLLLFWNPNWSVEIAAFCLLDCYNSLLSWKV